MTLYTISEGSHKNRAALRLAELRRSKGPR